MSGTAPTSPGPGLTAPAVGFFVISAASPLSVLLGTAPLILLFAGPGAAVSFLIIGVVLGLFARAYLPMTPRVARPDSFYAYVAHALGRRAGDGVALMTLVSYVSLALCGFALFGVYAAPALAEITGASAPWWVPALVAVAVVVGLGQLRIEVNARFLGALLLVEMCVLAVVGVSVLVQGGADGLSLSAFSPGTVLVPGMAIGVLFAFASCLGLESTVVYRTVVRDPARTIPRATYGVITFITVFHAFFLWLIVQAGGSELGDQLATDPTGTVLGIADRFAGPWASPTLSLLVLASILASCLAFHNMLNHFARTLATDGLLPRAYTHVSRRGVPWLAGATQAVAGVLVVLGSVALALDPYLGTYVLVSTPGVAGLLLTMTITAVATTVDALRTTGAPDRTSRLVASVSASILLAFLSVLVATQINVLTGLGAVTNTLLLMPPVAGLVVGLLRSRAGQGDPAAPPTVPA